MSFYGHHNRGQARSRQDAASATRAELVRLTDQNAKLREILTGGKTPCAGGATTIIVPNETLRLALESAGMPLPPWIAPRTPPPPHAM